MSTLFVGPPQQHRFVFHQIEWRRFIYLRLQTLIIFIQENDIVVAENYGESSIHLVINLKLLPKLVTRSK
ncbi:hypothetical protein CRN44_02990 [Vibrio vulnificus]|nr:hypothetical protein JS85_22320 [Vibrio vulnificus]POC66640.1 hypothetical protein CRN44_02990 [Vibrio vulnificus]